VRIYIKKIQILLVQHTNTINKNEHLLFAYVSYLHRNFMSFVWLGGDNYVSQSMGD
jgi:hypothetical protein